MNSLNNSEAHIVQGFVELTLYNKKTKNKIKQHNTITLAGKRYILARGMAPLLNTNGNIFGNMLAYSELGDFAYSSSSFNNVAKPGKVLTNMALHLGTNQSNLTEASTVLPIYDANGNLDTTAVLGKASIVSSSATEHDGASDIPVGSYVADDAVVCERWKYEAGVATGSIDTIAMVVTDQSGENVGSGLRTAKCIEKTSLTGGAFVSHANRFCPPGVTGATSASEIILNYETSGSSVHKYGIATGAVDDNPSMPFMFEQGTTDSITIDGYLYTVARQAVYIHDASTLATLGTISLPTALSNNAKFVKVGSDVYVSAVYSGSGYPNRLYKLTKSGAYYNKYDSSYVDASTIFSIPSAWSGYRHVVGSIDDRYVIYLYNRSSDNPIKCTAFIFTNKDSIANSLVECIPDISVMSYLFKYDNKICVLDCGLGSGDNLNTNGDRTTANRSIYNAQGDVEQTIHSYSLTTISLSDQYSTIMSFVKLQTPILKTEDDVLLVTYGYRVV